jgi:hypothetical protein
MLPSTKAMAVRWKQPMMYTLPLYTELFIKDWDQETNVKQLDVVIAQRKLRTPEQTLVCAVLERAIRDCLKYKDAKPDDQIDAGLWLWDNSLDDWSYFWCCDICNFDPHDLRRKIIALSNKRAALV